MVFKTKSEVERRKKASSACTIRNEKSRQKKAMIQGELISIGRRIFDLALLAKSMWCNACDVPLSFRYLQEENQSGAASVYKIRCYKCLVLHEVSSSSTVPCTTGSGRALFGVNCKFALGCIDSGVGHEQLNKLLSAVNLPVIHRNTMKLAEDRVGDAVVGIADQSCREAIAEEKLLSLSERLDADEPMPNPDDPTSMDISPPQTPPSSPSATRGIQDTPRLPRRRNTSTSLAGTSTATPVTPSEAIVDIVVKYDFGWDKRGNGFKYDSDSGRGSMIGGKNNKILGYKVLTSYCYMCARGLNPNNHACSKNYSGSAKGMEPKAAVDLMLKNPDLDAAGVRVSTVIGDKDSSTLAALRQQSSHHIRKIVDINHNLKSVNNKLYKLKKGQHKFLTSKIINYLKRCLCYAIARNAGDVEGVKKAILNISCHVHGEHDNCSSSWCHAINNPSYPFLHLPRQKPLSDPSFRADLNIILADQAAQAEQLAPYGHSLQNESFNHMCNTRAPKSRHYSGTKALHIRVAAAVCTKNYGSDYLQRTFDEANLSPSVTRYRKSLEERRSWKADHQRKPEIKKRRLYLKMKDTWRESTARGKEGYTYVSGMANTMERASNASRVFTWLPEPVALLPTCCPVIVDIETTGFSSEADIVQIAAKCGDKEFNAFVVPSGRFDSEASKVTGMTVEGGKLLRHGEILPTVTSYAAVRGFMDFLKSCSDQVVLVGHNIERFDGPRLMKLFAEYDMAKELCSLTFGLTDTLPLVSQGKVKKQDVLAKTYLLEPKWKELMKNAHDALADCCLLQGLLTHFEVTEEDLIHAVLPIRDFMERCAANKKKKENIPKLIVMQEHGISKGMIAKMASQGVTMEELIEEFNKHGRKGLDVCLGVQLGGKPRVTKSRKVLDKVENFVKFRLAQ